MLATLRAATVRMIDGVHSDTAVMRHAAPPPLTSGLPDRGVHVVRIRNGADSRHAATVHQALLRRTQADDDIILVATDDLHVAAGRARKLAALADLKLNVMHDSANRNVGDRHGIARLHVRVLGGNHGVARTKTLWRKDIGQLAVLILNQRDEAGAVWVVLHALDGGRHVELRATEIDTAIGLLVTAPAESGGDTAVIVAAARRILAFGQRLDRWTFM